MDVTEEREVIISESVSVGAAVLIDKGDEEKAADNPCWTSTTESRHEVEEQADFEINCQYNGWAINYRG